MVLEEPESKKTILPSSSLPVVTGISESEVDDPSSPVLAVESHTTENTCPPSTSSINSNNRKETSPSEFYEFKEEHPLLVYG